MVLWTRSTLASTSTDMRSLQFLVPAFMTTLAIGCTTPEVVNDKPVFNAAGVKAVLDSMNVHYHDRFRDSTPAYFAARYTSDALVMAPEMPRIQGIADITAFYWNKGESQTTSLDIKGEEVSGSESEVTEVGNYRVLDDEGTDMDKGKFIAIYRNEGGAWKVHREIWNSDMSRTSPADSTAHPAP